MWHFWAEVFHPMGSWVCSNTPHLIDGVSQAVASSLFCGFCVAICFLSVCGMCGLCIMCGEKMTIHDMEIVF